MFMNQKEKENVSWVPHLNACTIHHSNWRTVELYFANCMFINGAPFCGIKNFLWKEATATNGKHVYWQAQAFNSVTVFSFTFTFSSNATSICTVKSGHWLQYLTILTKLEGNWIQCPNHSQPIKICIHVRLATEDERWTVGSYSKHDNCLQTRVFIM